jgi:peptide-methionine (S)-S-oxide reductase
MEKATFGAGCFWCIEETFGKIKGVQITTCGYSGGKTNNPTYKQVCSSETGHVEVVEVVFDATKVSYEVLLDAFWGMHDPTQVDRQGPDVGTQYRSVIFYHSEEQKIIAQSSKEKLEDLKKFKAPIATQILPISQFYKAEEYHQKYFEKNR